MGHGASSESRSGQPLPRHGGMVDPNGNLVMYYGAIESTAAMLQLLIDAGGDVNRSSGGEPPLFSAVQAWKVDNVRVLLAQPSLDCTAPREGETPEQCARIIRRCAVANMIAQEVSGKGLPGWDRLQEDSKGVERLIVLAVCVWRCCHWKIARRAKLVRPLFLFV